MSTTNVFSLPFRAFPRANVGLIVVMHRARVRFISGHRYQSLVRKHVRPNARYLSKGSTFHLVQGLGVLVTQLPRTRRVGVTSLSPYGTIRVFRLLFHGARATMHLGLLFSLLRRLYHGIRVNVTTLRYPYNFVIKRLIVSNLSRARFMRVYFRRANSSLVWLRGSSLFFLLGWSAVAMCAPSEFSSLQSPYNTAPISHEHVLFRSHAHTLPRREL